MGVDSGLSRGRRLSVPKWSQSVNPVPLVVRSSVGKDDLFLGSLLKEDGVRTPNPHHRFVLTCLLSSGSFPGIPSDGGDVRDSLLTSFEFPFRGRV